MEYGIWKGYILLKYLVLWILSMKVNYDDLKLRGV